MDPSFFPLPCHLIFTSTLSGGLSLTYKLRSWDLEQLKNLSKTKLVSDGTGFLKAFLFWNFSRIYKSKENNTKTLGAHHSASININILPLLFYLPPPQHLHFLSFSEPGSYMGLVESRACDIRHTCHLLEPF